MQKINKTTKHTHIIIEEEEIHLLLTNLCRTNESEIIKIYI